MVTASVAMAVATAVLVVEVVVMVVVTMPGLYGAACGAINGSADCELHRSEKTARNEGWRRY